MIVGGSGAASLLAAAAAAVIVLEMMKRGSMGKVLKTSSLWDQQQVVRLHKTSTSETRHSWWWG